MSTSLKVVSIAAVFCASLRRRAMVWRSRVMRTRSSRAGRRAPRRRAPRPARARGPAGARRRRPSTAVSASPLVTRPSLPVPATRAGSTSGLGQRLARRRRRRPGGRLPVPVRGFAQPDGGGAGGDRSRGAALVVGRTGIGRAFAGRACRRRHWRSIEPSTAPTPTVAPSLTAIASMHAGGRRRHFQRDLVGLQLDQRLVGR